MRSKKIDAARELERSRQNLRELGSKVTEADIQRVKDAEQDYKDARK